MLTVCLFFITCVCVSADLSDSGKETQTLAADQEELEGNLSSHLYVMKHALGIFIRTLPVKFKSNSFNTKHNTMYGNIYI